MAKFGIKAWSLLSSALFAMIVVVGCNPEEPAPTPSTPSSAPKAGAAPTKPTTPPATSTKPDEKKP